MIPWGGWGGPGPPPRAAGGRGGTGLLEQGRDHLSKAVARPVETTFHRAQVATGDVGDLSVALPFQLAQHEHRAVVRGELSHALIHRLFEIALAVQVVGARRGVFEL